jgi:hypothetical protein
VCERERERERKREGDVDSRKSLILNKKTRKENPVSSLLARNPFLS